ncbi:hypothetical protein GCM10009765_12710 [Fodinicola feengrottensis]|uniref:Uncharacterized protein n=1 Tax=Fodinicola feengrottensis TaxID=435914 RepID=A0ABN2G391_9ACTN
MALRLRLTSVDAELAATISAATPDTQRSIAEQTVNFLYARAPFSPHDDNIAIQQLRNRRYGDTPERQHLKDAAFNAEKAAREAWQAGDDTASERERAITFAYKAAYYALSENPETAALETVYEARFSHVPGEVFALVRSILDAP